MLLSAHKVWWFRTVYKPWLSLSLVHSSLSFMSFWPSMQLGPVRFSSNSSLLLDCHHKTYWQRSSHDAAQPSLDRLLLWLVVSKGKQGERSEQQVLLWFWEQFSDRAVGSRHRGRWEQPGPSPTCAGTEGHFTMDLLLLLHGGRHFLKKHWVAKIITNFIWMKEALTFLLAAVFRFPKWVCTPVKEELKL